MEPPPLSFIALMAVFMPMKTPVRLMSRTLRKCSTVSVSRGWPVEMPALLTRPSIPPNSAVANAATAVQSSSDVTSCRMNRARSPSPAARALPSSSRTSVTTTLAPASTARRAVSAPMPRAPPVIRTVLPVRSFMDAPVEVEGGSRGRNR